MGERYDASEQTVTLANGANISLILNAGRGTTLTVFVDDGTEGGTPAQYRLAHTAREAPRNQSLLVEAGETYTIQYGESETYGSVIVDGTLIVEGSLTATSVTVNGAMETNGSVTITSPIEKTIGVVTGTALSHQFPAPKERVGVTLTNESGGSATYRLRAVTHR